MPLNENKHSKPETDPANCRSCVDFKSWAKQQRKLSTTTTVRMEICCEMLWWWDLFCCRKRTWRRTMRHRKRRQGATVPGTRISWVDRLGGFCILWVCYWWNFIGRVIIASQWVLEFCNHQHDMCNSFRSQLIILNSPTRSRSGM